jgi:hypothetical protein
VSESASSEAGVQHVDRVEEGLAEMRHLQYVTVEEAAYDAAAVRVRDNGTASNPLVNNGEFALFHRLGYVAHHVDYRERFIDLRYLGETDGGE